MTMLLRRALCAMFAIGLWGASAQAAGTFSGLPDASVPLTGADEMPLDQGAGCAGNTTPCATKRVISLRVGQPIQTNCLAIMSPFPYQQCIDTSVSPPVLKEYIVSTWVSLFQLSPTSPTVLIPVGALTSPFLLGATSVTTTGVQLNYLNAATGTTGTASSNIVFSASPALTGTPTAPTAAACDSSTTIATTAFITTTPVIETNTGAIVLPATQRSTVWAPASPAAVIFTLPASPLACEYHELKNNLTTGAYSLKLAASGGQTIDGQTYWVLARQYDTIAVRYIGSNKWILE